MNDNLTLSLSRLPAEAREEAARWHAALTGVTAPVTRSLRQIAADLGVSYQSAVRRYYAWKERGVAGLVSGRVHPDFAGSRRGALSAELREYYRQLCFENQRKCRTAFRKLCREFFAGADIPGLAPGTDRCRLPAGWTYSNFQQHAPTKFELRAGRQGLRAASEFRPLVYTSRREMHFFQELQFDDVWHDIECSLLDRCQRVRPQQLGAMDVLSACLCEWCIKPRIRRDDDSRVSLGPNDMIYLLAAIFGKYGHSAQGTRLNLEAGTASLSDEAVDLVHRLSGGLVRCRIGETSNEPAFLGQYRGTAKGNFRTRSLIESFWNLTHNETADRLQFPGQTGSLARVNAPEDLHGRGRAQDLMLRAMPALPEHVLTTLRQPLPEWYQTVRALGEINERMNRRGMMPGTQHEIEGFAEAGLVTTEFDLPGVGLVTRREFESRLKGLSEAQKEAVMAVCQPRARRLSPREVFDAGVKAALPGRPDQAPLAKWPREAIAQLLYAARREEPVSVGKDHLVTFSDEDISPEPLRYLAHHFTPGTEFLAACNPMVPDLLFIYDASARRRGAWLGVLTLWGRVSRADQEAVGHRIGQARKVQDELLGPVAALGARITEQRIQEAEANARALREPSPDEAVARAMDGE